MLQNFNSLPVRSAAILTDSYVVGTKLTPSNVDPVISNQLILLIDFTIGSLDSAEVKIEFSLTGEDSTWHQETADSVSGGTISQALGVRQFTASGLYRIPIPILDGYIRISAKGTGTATSSSMTIKAIIGTV